MTATTTPAGATDSTAPEPIRPEASGVITGLLAAGQAIVTGLLLVIVPAIAIWILTPKISVPWSEAVRVAANVYVLAQGGSLALAHGQVDVVPLGLAAPLTWVAWLGGCRLRGAAESLDGVPARRLLVTGSVVFIAVHAVATTVIAAVAGNTAARAPLGAALTGSAAIAIIGLAIALYPVWQPSNDRWPLLIGTAARMLLGWLGVGLALVLLGLALGFSRVVDVQQALHPGAAGHLLLLFVQLLLLPTAIVWAASYATGSGFALGSGTWISPGHTELGPMPAVPLLGAVPEPGRHAVAMILLPVAVIGLAAYLGYRLQALRGAQLVATRVVDALLTSGVVAGVAFALAGLSSGAVGPGRMADVGPSPLGLALTVFLEVLLGLLLGTFLGPLVASGRAGDAAGRGARKAAGKAREISETAARNARDIGAPAVGRAKEKARDKAKDASRSLRRDRPASTRPNSRPRR